MKMKMMTAMMTAIALVIVFIFSTTVYAVSTESTIDTAAAEFKENFNLCWKESEEVFEKIKAQGRVSKRDVKKLRGIQKKYQEVIEDAEGESYARPFTNGWEGKFFEEIPSNSSFEDFGGLIRYTPDSGIQVDPDLEVLVIQNLVADNGNNGYYRIVNPKKDSFLLVYGMESDTTLYAIKSSRNFPSGTVTVFLYLAVGLIGLVLFSVSYKETKKKKTAVAGILLSTFIVIHSIVTISVLLYLLR